ncbi:Aldo/keto reductase [Rhodocollybia butyracea]|uniref:Aldo/keto reductase n=1 Tax=Rhodocollybia butyracea TaxID=206335 RepID=A0A9P5PV24_9AGAR|nr:Aldo/keto reductase [Rhodocollybia butyracea]
MATRVPLIFGTMVLGNPGKNGVRISEVDECQHVIDVFMHHGHTELDTARMYAEGTTEELISKLNIKNATIDTKVYPVQPGDHAPAALRSSFFVSLKKLKREKVRVLYLHAPDRSVPFEETVAEIDKLYKEGRFEIFGLSNFASWEVAEIVGICKANKYVLPRIYQAFVLSGCYVEQPLTVLPEFRMYNAITREIEPELVPCLRKFGLRLVIYNPLAGGFFAGKIASVEDPAAAGGRFDNSGSAMGKLYRARFLNDGYFKALDHLKNVVGEHELRLTEIALRWCQHHSVLTPEDGIIIGASSPNQVEQNCKDSIKGPLPDAVLIALDEAHRIVISSGSAPLYWR